MTLVVVPMAAAAAAVRLVLRWSLPVRAVRQRAVPDVVDVGHLHVDLHRRPADGGRADGAEVGVLVRQHQLGAADLELTVPDPAVVADVAHRLASVEHGGVPVDRTDGVIDGDVRMERSGRGAGGGRRPGQHAQGLAVTPSTWTGEVVADTSTTSAGAISPDRFFADLPDVDFMYPGDVLHYYISATDAIGGVGGSDPQTSLMPADTTGFLGSEERNHFRYLTGCGHPARCIQGGALVPNLLSCYAARFGLRLC